MEGRYPLPKELRERLAKPQGRLFTAGEIESEGFEAVLSGSSSVVTVGDRVTETVAAKGRLPDLQIVDSRENRKVRELPRVPYSALYKVRNPAGTITIEAVEGIRRAFGGEKPARVLVDGEEDLLAIPALILSPPSAALFYGQPGSGIVMLKADELTKSRNREILKKMGLPEV